VANLLNDLRAGGLEPSSAKAPTKDALAKTGVLGEVLASTSPKATRMVRVHGVHGADGPGSPLSTLAAIS